MKRIILQARHLTVTAVLFILPACVVLPPSISPPSEIEISESETREYEDNNSKYQTKKETLKIHSRLKVMEDIHMSILAFADRYMERIAQVSDEFISSDISAMDREFIQSMRVAYVSSAIAIATATKPLNQLLDMYIMVELQLLVWEETRNPILLKYKERMISTLRTLKLSINDIVYKVLATEDIDLLDSIISQWRKSNKDQFYVAFIRFDGFQASDEKDKLVNNVLKKGIFGSIKSAEQDLHDIKRLSERALFLANRMPILLRWQSELFIYRLASTDEFFNMEQNMDAFRASIENASNTFSSLPVQFDVQKTEFIQELAAEIHTQRQKTLEHLDSVLSSQRAALFADIDNHSDSLIDIFRELGFVTQSLQNTTASIEAILEKNQNEEIESSNFSFSDMHEMIRNSNTLTDNLKNILEFFATNDLVHEQEIHKAGMVLDKLITKIFFLTTCFVIITIMLTTVSVFYLRKKLHK